MYCMGRELCRKIVQAVYINLLELFSYFFFHRSCSNYKQSSSRYTRSFWQLHRVYSCAKPMYTKTLSIPSTCWTRFQQVFSCHSKCLAVTASVYMSLQLHMFRNTPYLDTRLRSTVLKACLPNGQFHTCICSETPLTSPRHKVLITVHCSQSLAH